MNGGVTTICAGELARGALVSGHEQYGVDIIRRLNGWADRLDGYLHAGLKGKLPEVVSEHGQPISIAEFCNISFRGDGAGLGWAGESDNDMRGLPSGEQLFQGVRFSVIDPNAAKGCIGLAQQEGYAKEVTVPLSGNARSVYFLHACQGNAAPLGWLTFRYADGTHVTQYVNPNKEIESFFMPAPDSAFVGGNKGKPRGKNLRVAWQGANGAFENVGMFVYGGPTHTQTVNWYR